ILIEEEFISENGSSTVKVTEGGLYVENSGETVFGFQQPIAFDSNTAEENHLQGNLSYSTDGNTISLSTKFDLSWMLNSARAFPLHLDPIISYFPLNVTFWTGYQASATAKTTGYIRVARAN